MENDLKRVVLTREEISMATTFSVGDRVGWNPDSDPFLLGHQRESYGDGPFEVVSIFNRPEKVMPYADHPQLLEISDGDIASRFSGSWFVRVSE